MATVELAVATSPPCFIMLLLSWGIYLMVVQVRCIDTAGEVGSAGRTGRRRGRRAGPPRGTRRVSGPDLPQ